ncbi:MAG: PEP-CTERM system histidine kinase PrsK [Rhodospirillales bacterium]|nr:PEP-CTERM system histidine kinase PrsK [Rhodospirillales bacterium]
MPHTAVLVLPLTTASIAALLHLAAGALYALLAAIVLTRRGQSGTGRRFGAACALTAAWALSAAAGTGGPAVPLPAWLDLLRFGAWYGFTLHVYRRSTGPSPGTVRLFAALAGVPMAIGAMVLLAPNVPASIPSPALWSAGIGARMGLAIAMLLLLENLYRNTPQERRWSINLLCIGFGSVQGYDLLLAADALLHGHPSALLLAARPLAVALVAPLLALAAARNRRWQIDIHLSRQVVFHTATLVVSGLFLLGVAFAGEVLRHDGSEWGRVAQIAVVFGGVLAVAVLVTSASARSRLRSLCVDHFFSARYDYRREWMRCIDTLTAQETHTGLPVRAIRAVADVVDSPAGALFVRAPDEVAFQWAGSWNLPSAVDPVPPGDALVAAFGAADRIVVLDGAPALRRGIAELGQTWLAVPLNHFGRLIGFVVLAGPRAAFTLDREVFDLLRVLGREVASRIAEQRAAQVLSQTAALREYSERFAFVLHDIKNVSGQLSMLLTNAEIHAANPDFQRDMLATVRASVNRITRLLRRLQADRRERAHAVLTLGDRVRAAVAAAQLAHAADIRLEPVGTGAGVAIDPDAFDAVLRHVIDNAVDAAGDAPVLVRGGTHGPHVVVEVIDRGPGMSAAFIRDRLFTPFASTKPGGHGIGAYQARALLRAAGGALLVQSTLGAGTTMRLVLPRVEPDVAALAHLPAA